MAVSGSRESQTSRVSELADPDARAAALLELAESIKRRARSPRSDDLEFFAGASRQIRLVGAGLPQSYRSIQVDAYLDVAKWFHDTGRDPYRGLEATAEAVALARRLDEATLRRALTGQGAITFMAGNAPGAIEQFAEAYDLALRLQDERAVLVNLANLASALIDLSQYGDAAKISEAVIRRSPPDAEAAVWRAGALSSLALCHLRRRDYDAGLAAAREAVEELGNPNTQVGKAARVVAERIYVWLLLKKNLVGLAAERAALARAIAAEARSLTAEIAAGVASALVDAAAGRTDLAHSRIQDLVESSRHLKPALPETLLAAVEIAVDAGKDQDALSFERELAVHLQQERERRTLYHHALRMRELRAQPRPAAWGPELRDWLAQRCAALEQFAVAATLPTDPSGTHAYRVSALLGALAQAFGLPEDAAFTLELAARLHDIGNQFVPDHVLTKPGALTEAQRQLLQMHTILGADLIAKSSLPHELKVAEEMARYHHEHFDGTGYPMRLKGNAIPLAARMLALCDTFDALTHDRPHRTRCAVPEALAEIAARKGAQFDPYLTDLFVAMVRRLQVEVDDLDAYLERGAPETGFVRRKATVLRGL